MFSTRICRQIFSSTKFNLKKFSSIIFMLKLSFRFVDQILSTNSFDKNLSTNFLSLNLPIFRLCEHFCQQKIYRQKCSKVFTNFCRQKFFRDIFVVKFAPLPLSKHFCRQKYVDKMFLIRICR